MMITHWVMSTHSVMITHLAGVEMLWNIGAAEGLVWQRFDLGRTYGSMTDAVFPLPLNISTSTGFQPCAWSKRYTQPKALPQTSPAAK